MKKYNFKRTVIYVCLGFLLIVFSSHRYFEVSAMDGVFYNTDIGNYLRYYGDRSYIETYTVDYLYFLLTYFLSLFVSFEFFLALVVFVFFGSIVRFYNSCFGVNVRSIFFLWLCLFYPIYTSLTEVVIRQGLGFSVLFYLDFFNVNSNFKKRFFALVIASMFHFAFVFLFLVFFICIYIKNLRNIICVWMGITLAYIFDLPLIILNNVVPSSLLSGIFAIYAEIDYTKGFKPAFLFFSIVPVIFFLSNKFRALLRRNDSARYVFSIYLISNLSGFFLSGFAYYDRFMIFSWVLIPFLIFYFINTIHGGLGARI